VQTKRVRDRLKRKHPRSEEMLGNVQRWATASDARETPPTSSIGDEVGSEERETRGRRKQEAGSRGQDKLEV